MRKRLVWVILAVVSVGVLAVVTREREPEYGGKKLSEWLESYPRASRHEEIDEAIRRIGTNAVPHLLKWIAYDTPLLKTIYYDLRRKLFKKASNWGEDPREVRAERALEAIYLLGPEGHAAIPRLCELVGDGGDRSSVWRAEAALMYLGKDGFEALWLTSKRSPRRILFTAFYIISQHHAYSPPAIPGLIRFLKHPDEFVAQRAAKLLGELEREPNLVVPALTDCLQDTRWKVRSEAAHALSFFGADASSAVPALNAALNDTSVRVRSEATSTLSIVNWLISHKTISE